MAGRSSASLYDRSLMLYSRCRRIEKATRLFLLRSSPVTKMSIPLLMVLERPLKKSKGKEKSTD
jgi:hypothetical protein